MATLTYTAEKAARIGVSDVSQKNLAEASSYLFAVGSVDAFSPKLKQAVAQSMVGFGVGLKANTRWRQDIILSVIAGQQPHHVSCTRYFEDRILPEYERELPAVFDDDYADEMLANLECLEQKLHEHLGLSAKAMVDMINPHLMGIYDSYNQAISQGYVIKLLEIEELLSSVAELHIEIKEENRKIEVHSMLADANVVSSLLRVHSPSLYDNLCERIICEYQDSENALRKSIGLNIEKDDVMIQYVDDYFSAKKNTLLFVLGHDTKFNQESLFDADYVEFSSHALEILGQYLIARLNPKTL